MFEVLFTVCYYQNYLSTVNQQQQIFIHMGFYRSVKQFNFANEPIKIAKKMIKTLSWNYLLVLYAAYNCKHFRILFTIEANCINPEQTAP